MWILSRFLLMTSSLLFACLVSFWLLKCRTVPTWSSIWFEFNLFQSHSKFYWIIIKKTPWVKVRYPIKSGVHHSGTSWYPVITASSYKVAVLIMSLLNYVTHQHTNGTQNKLHKHHTKQVLPRVHNLCLLFYLFNFNWCSLNKPASLPPPSCSRHSLCASVYLPHLKPPWDLFDSPPFLNRSWTPVQCQSWSSVWKMDVMQRNSMQRAVYAVLPRIPRSVPSSERVSGIGWDGSPTITFGPSRRFPIIPHHIIINRVQLTILIFNCLISTIV